MIYVIKNWYVTICIFNYFCKILIELNRNVLAVFYVLILNSISYSCRTSHWYKRLTCFLVLIINKVPSTLNVTLRIFYDFLFRIDIPLIDKLSTISEVNLSFYLIIIVILPTNNILIIKCSSFLGQNTAIYEWIS